MAEPILRVDNLCCGFHTEDGYIRVVDGVTFECEAGKTLGLVGESGCGKTVSALAVMGLLPQPAGVIEEGQILFRGEDLASTSHETMRVVRGQKIGMIFQEPMTALNPVHRVGKQLFEALRLYGSGRDQDEPAVAGGAAPGRRNRRGRRLYESRSEKNELTARAVELLEQVGIPDPVRRLREYPHQLSGGMRQRVMIAMALAGQPDILIADEPTTALDVTVQAQILDLLRELQQARGMTMIFITHDLGVVAEFCDEVLVMYAGRIAERAPVGQLFKTPRHPYTRGLIESLPRMDTPSQTPLNTIEGVVPKLTEMPAGCRFSNRCAYADERCGREVPVLESCAERGAVGEPRDPNRSGEAQAAEPRDPKRSREAQATEPRAVRHEVACHHWQRLAA